MLSLQTRSERYAEIRERINELRRLPENWYSYGGTPPSRRALKEADVFATSFDRPFLPVAQIVPTSGGGVQLEWHCGGWDVEVEIAPDAAEVTVGYARNGSDQWNEGDYLDHAARLYEVLDEMNAACCVQLGELAAARAVGEPEAEIRRLREALFAVTQVENGHHVCRRHGNPEAPETGWCECVTVLDADEKAREIAIEALRLTNPKSKESN
jgi:hypothetical protein